MMKPIELIAELGAVVGISLYNYAITNFILPNLDFDEVANLIIKFSTVLTSCLLIIYLAIRCIKIYWEAVKAKYDALNSKNENQL